MCAFNCAKAEELVITFDTINRSYQAGLVRRAHRCLVGCEAT